MESTGSSPVKSGDGWAAAHLSDLGDGPGFRKVRKGLGVTAFGVNAIVLPPGLETGFHFHDSQEELYFVHRGSIEIEFGDGTVQRLDEGGLARVDAPVPRKIRNPGGEDAVYLIAGGKDGYVGRDGRVPAGEEQRVRAIHDAGGDTDSMVGDGAAAPRGLRVRGGPDLPADEITLRTSRSSGPGGQHANVTASRVEASFDVLASRALDERQRELVLNRLGSRVVAVAQDTRSQSRNRELALERLAERIAGALEVTPERRATKPTAGSRERRLTAKRQASQRKLARRPPDREG